MKSTQSRPIIGRRKRGLQPGLESDATPNTTITKTTGPYDRAFEQHLLDHNIYPDGFVHPNGDDNPEPENLDEIREVLEQRRKSLSPSRFTKDDFKNFRRVEVDAKKERQVAKHVIPIIEGDVGDRKCAQTDIAFANLSHLTDGSLVYAKPDVYYGARPTLLKKEIRAELSNLIIPSTAEELPILANNTLEFKGPDGSSSVADRQATYNGALGSRAMRALQTYRAVDQPYDNKAYTLAWTYQAGQLKAFANHPIASSPGMPPGYVMTQINTWAISGNRDAFCRGVAAFRNGRDWAKSQRDQAIERANDIITKATTTDLQHKSPTTEDCFENTSHVTTSNEAPTSHHSTDTSEEEFLNPAKRARTQGEQASNVRSNQGD
ncbi:hypothetical protein CDD82_7077 [Ophiocordyceps australis]|uniref:Uncharacterized protein n=1 Tax=Ophiocordyceps australis TaxID=1399860 RepID=A0A2C5ZQH0_9HYPO|nr:hypothetical protein CDD82_7077 [Ophiocordyceps australis]